MLNFPQYFNQPVTLDTYHGIHQLVFKPAETTYLWEHFEVAGRTATDGFQAPDKAFCFDCTHLLFHKQSYFLGDQRVGGKDRNFI